MQWVTSRSGGIGRRAGFKIQFWQQSGSSSLPGGTNAQRLKAVPVTIRLGIAQARHLQWSWLGTIRMVKDSMSMKYRVVIRQTDEGYSVSCPGFLGCWSQVATEAEAIGNIRDAIAEYQAAVTATLVGENVREVEVAD